MAVLRCEHEWMDGCSPVFDKLMCFLLYRSGPYYCGFGADKVYTVALSWRHNWHITVHVCTLASRPPKLIS